MLGQTGTPTIAEVFIGDLAAVGNWVVANVRSSVAWPLTVETVDFRGHRIFLVPRTTATVVANGSTVTMYPFAAVNMADGAPFRDGRHLLSQFLSSLCWVEGGGITVEHWTGGSRAHPMGESRPGGIVTSQFELDYLPDPTDQCVRWALAFYREGLSLDRDNVAYATLSFFKILNIIADTGRKQKAWINANYANFGLTNHTKFEINRRITELKSSGITDIGGYLYESGRCAVAHAGTSPTVDPENPEDIERLTKDLPLVRGMAAHVIEKEFAVKSRFAIWDEHLYELAGFKDLLGPAVTVRLEGQGRDVNGSRCRSTSTAGHWHQEPRAI
jgi:Methylamine utilization protein MauJ